MKDITQIILALLALLFAVAGVYLLPAVRSFLREKMTVAQHAELCRIVKIGVRAAEQIFAGSGRGAEKKAHVLAFLEAHGLTADFDIIDEMIEAEVLALKRGENTAGE